MVPRTSMARYETYQSNAAEAPLMRKWMLWGLFISLGLHAALFVTFRLKKLENFGSVEVPVSAPIPINMKRPVIPKMEDKETRIELSDAKPKMAALQVPIDKPEVQDVILAPQFPDFAKPLQGDKPKADLAGLDALVKAEQKSRGDMDRELNSLAGALIKDSVRAPRQPLLSVVGGKVGGGGVGTAEGIPGLKSMSDLLGETGTLKSGARGGIPGGALYEHGSAELKDAARTQLQKLGELIKRNASATFVIEGHTDSTGTPERNQQLSEERAESVKAWLVENMSIDPERIQTVGLGSAKMIVPPSAYNDTVQGEIDAEIIRQQLNRRVEIVIRMNRR